MGVREDNSPFFSTTVPGFLNCTRAGTLPGCLYKFDQPNDQCAPGREGRRLWRLPVLVLVHTEHIQAHFVGSVRMDMG